MKTVKQIANELGIDKQKVYRYIKSHGIEEIHQDCINEAHQKNSTKYYDEVAENLIKQGFADNSASQEVYQEVHRKQINDTVNDTLLKQIEILQKELETKNNQIESLTRLLDQQQQLCAVSQKKIEELEDKQKEPVEPQQKKSWWKFWN